MKIKILYAGFITALVLSPVAGAALEKATPAFHEEISRAWDDIGGELRDWFGRWRDHFTSSTARDERPVISLILRNREKLELSTDQARQLEQLRKDFQKDLIRKEADLRIAEMDLNTLLETQPVDMTKVEAKIREIERFRADIRVSRIRTIEKGKEQLTADQRKKLQDLLSDRTLSRSQSGTEPR